MLDFLRKLLVWILSFFDSPPIDEPPTSSPWKPIQAFNPDLLGLNVIVAEPVVHGQRIQALPDRYHFAWQPGQINNVESPPPFIHKKDLGFQMETFAVNGFMGLGQHNVILTPGRYGIKLVARENLAGDMSGVSVRGNVVYEDATGPVSVNLNAHATDGFGSKEYLWVIEVAERKSISFEVMYQLVWAAHDGYVTFQRIEVSPVADDFAEDAVYYLT